jgi:hypothetical protein
VLQQRAASVGKESDALSLADRTLKSVEQCVRLLRSVAGRLIMKEGPEFSGRLAVSEQSYKGVCLCQME